MITKTYSVQLKCSIVKQVNNLKSDFSLKDQTLIP